MSEKEKIFNPVATKIIKINQVYPSQDNPIDLGEFTKTMVMIGAIPELLNVLKAARNAVKEFDETPNDDMAFPMEGLQVSIELLDQMHGTNHT